MFTVTLSSVQKCEFMFQSWSLVKQMCVCLLYCKQSTLILHWKPSIIIDVDKSTIRSSKHQSIPYQIICGKNYSCHLQDECWWGEGGQRSLYSSVTVWRVGGKGVIGWNRSRVLSNKEQPHSSETGDENSFTKHMIKKRGYDKSLINHVIMKGVENINGNQEVRKWGVVKSSGTHVIRRIGHEIPPCENIFSWSPL